MISEPALIRRFFAPLSKGAAGSFALTDDAALLPVKAGREYVVSVDAYAEGVHFLPASPPDLIGEKVLRAALSDLAAMGAKPVVWLLSASLPSAVTENWIKSFARGAARVQRRFAVKLAGGDTIAVKGKMEFSLTVIGEVKKGRAIMRSGMKAGDGIYVSGTLGMGILGLLMAKNKIPRQKHILRHYYQPEPRLALGQKLAGIASAALDVSDGLAADLAQLVRASKTGAMIDLAALPLAPAKGITKERLYLAALTGGDDYELLFAVPPKFERRLAALARAAKTPITRIGEAKGKSIKLLYPEGVRPIGKRTGYQHTFGR